MNTKLRTFLAPLAVCTLGAPAILAATGAWTAPARASELEESMQTLQAGVKGLDRALEKAEVEKALGLVVDMQGAVRTAKLGAPPKAAEIADAGEKAKLVAGYRLELIELERGLLDVEAALVQGKPQDAKKALDARVKPLKKRGHDKYKD